MSTAATTKRNGKVRQSPVCKHSPNCEVAQTQRDLQAQVQAFSESIGEGMERIALALEHVKQRQEVHSDRMMVMNGHLSDLAERQTIASQREEEWVRSVNELTRLVSRWMEESNA